MRLALMGLAVCCGLALLGTARAGEVCPTLLDEAGAPSDLDGCALEELLARADLRGHLSSCVRRALEVELPPPARLEFRLALYPGGGAERLELVGGAEAGLLGRCTLRVLGTRFAGGRGGRPALVEGWLRLTPDEPARFAFGLAAAARVAPPPPAPLPGGFRDSPEGPLSRCALDGRWLVVRLGGGGEVFPDEEPGPVDARVEACQAEAPSARPAKGRPAPRPVRPEACLEELLRAPQLELRAGAAEALARRRSWRSRRAIERALLASLQPPFVGGGSAAGAGRAGLAGAETARPLVAPTEERAALGVLRLLESALALYRQPDPAVVEALAAHPSPAVRGRLLAGALVRWRGEAGGALRSLSRAPEPLLRARAQQLGCLRGEPQSLHAFREDLLHPEPVVRAQAVLLARACARRSTPEVLAAAAREPAGPVVVLLLQAAPADAVVEVRRLAPAALSDACPATRFLAAHLLARLPAPPREPVLAALERERDPILRGGLEALLREPAERAPVPTAQVWLQDIPGAGTLPSGGQIE